MRDGWKEISLEDLETSGVIKLGRGDVISKKDMEADPGPNPVYSSAENKNGMIGKYAKFMFDEELITWSVDGGGHIFYRPKHKFSVTNIGGWLRILDDKVFSYQFLTYALQRLHKQHSFDWQHKAHPSVIRKLYTRIPLPPLPEQKRIVDLISSVDSYIEALQQQLESSKRSRNAVLHELLTAGGDDWVETTLHGIADVIMGQSPDGKSYNQEGKGLPFMQGSAEFGEHNPVPEKWCSDPKKIAEPGDLLLSVRAPVGDTNFADQRIAVGRGLSIIRANKESLTEFIRLVIQLNVVELIASSGGGMFASITGKNLKEFKVNLPPLPEQKRIVEIINTIDEVIAKTALTTNKAKELRSGLLSDLLSGEHKIPAGYDKVIGAA